MERDVKNYKRMICKMAWDYLHSFKGQKDIDDLISDGYEVFVKVCNREREKPLTCEFHTALAVKLKCKWLDELKTMHSQKRGFQYIQVQLGSTADEEYKHNFMSIERMEEYFDLTKEMRIVAHLLLDTPSELAELSKSFSLPESIGRYLKKAYNWKPHQINRLKTQLKQIRAEI